jgi:hypothetical protein
MVDNEDVLERAEIVGELERSMAEEWLRLVGSGVNGFEATKRVDLLYAASYRLAQASYELALSCFKKEHH